ncbi:MAG: UbiX family flavin prenyltransferase [Methanobrevibacter sp.]|jgi:4-hydroxy-3-polyprenylbenzoate decarboxylase|nr:UbiX family flavin prenyltransferase [Methanobrevibacter sp.]
MILIAITGASGVIYGEKLLNALKKLNIKTGLIISKNGKIVIEQELKSSIDDLKGMADEYYHSNDMTSKINSGSFKFDSLVILPCSMKTLSAIANGYGNNSITRAADVVLKERRNLVIVPRETPLRSAHLENMLKISKEGGIILPAMPGFYHNPKNIDEICDFLVGKILDVLKIENNEFKRWKS